MFSDGIAIFTTDNGAEVFTWQDAGMTPFRATKATDFRSHKPSSRPVGRDTSVFLVTSLC